MRLPFQSKNIIYEVISELKFDRMGEMTQKTYYGSDYPISKQSILNKAKENIKRKLENSSGKIISIKITAIYK